MKEILVALLAFGLRTAAAEETADASDVSMAATLIGAISFMMILFYFTNYDDKDIQESTWNIISNTISIFCAVLMFQSFNAFVEEHIIAPYFGEEEASLGALLVDMCHMLWWFTVLQILLAKVSGAFKDDELLEKFRITHHMSEDEKISQRRKKLRDQKRRSLDLSCYAVLMAHLTGFASINAWGTVQQFAFFRQSALHSLLAVPIAFFGQLLLQRVSDLFREWKALSDDGKKSWWEDKWDSQAEEAENDVMGLTLSFLTMNSIRLAVSGCLPNQEGEEEECPVEQFLYNHTLGQKVILTLVILLTTVAIFTVVFFFPVEEEEEEELDSEEDTEEEEEGEGKKPLINAHEVLTRIRECLTVALSMLFSWAFFYGMQLWVAGLMAFCGFYGMQEFLAVSLAMAISLSGFGLLVVFDYIADADAGGDVVKLRGKLGLNKSLGHEELEKMSEELDEKVDRGLRQIMIAIGFAIGFAWEQCFDRSVVDIASRTKNSKVFFVNPSTTKMALAIFCSALLVPAWRLYVLPFVYEKGWRYGWAVNLHEKYCEGKKVLLEDEDAKKLNFYRKQIKKLVSKAFEGEGKESSKEEKMAAEASYKSLPSSDVEALKVENSQLKKQLEVYRNMFDKHMNNMGQNLKTIHGILDKVDC